MAVRALVQLHRADFFDAATSLRQQSAEVVEFGQALRQLVADLTDTLVAHRIAVGLAAPQIGVNRRVAVINPDRERREPTWVLVNPVIVSSRGQRDRKRESCMSLPDYAGEVERRKKVTVRYCDLDGKERIREAEGFLARIVLHEVDHLNGVLYVDRLEGEAALVETDLFTQD